MNTMHANNVTTALPHLCLNVLSDGSTVPSRNGATRELLHTMIKLDRPWQREVLNPERKADIVAQIAETLWVLSGSNDAEWLSAYLPRALDFSDDGKTWRAGYGPRLRSWEPDQDDRPPIDQLARVIEELSTNPGSRRAVVSIWDPALDYEDSKDVPCNNWLHFLIRDGELHLAVAIRSNDLMWGWSGINQFEWSALQELVASILEVGVGPLVFHVSSLHLYEQHWKKAERIAHAAYPADAADSPRANVSSVSELDRQLGVLMQFEQQLRTGTRNVTWHDLVDMDPMLRSWASVLAWHWTKDESWIRDLMGTRLYLATELRPTGKPSSAQLFASWAAELHAEKHAVYGDSWKKRGEFVSIQANIARKIDRLGKAGAGDDELDTTTDLLVYLVKYHQWLAGVQTDGPEGAENVARELAALAQGHRANTVDPNGQGNWLTAAFEQLLGWTEPLGEQKGARYEIEQRMIPRAFSLALYHWEAQQRRLAELDAALQQAPTGEGAGHAARNATRSWAPELDEPDFD